MHRKLVVALGGCEGGPRANMAMLEALLGSMPELRELVVVPLAPHLLPEDTKDRCEAAMARVSRMPGDDETWVGVTVLPPPPGACVACPITHRAATLPGLVPSATADTAGQQMPMALRGALSLYGRRLHCWALGRRAAETAQWLCEFPPSIQEAPDADVAVILIDRACDLVQVLRHGRRLGDALAGVTQRWSPVSSDLKVCRESQDE